MEMAARYPDGLVPQGISAELIAAKWGLSPPELDEFSARSHEKAARRRRKDSSTRSWAHRRAVHRRDHPPRHHRRDAGGFEAGVLQRGHRRASRRSSGRSRPGNSSPLSDGSAAVMITSGAAARKLGLRRWPASTPYGGGVRPAVHADRCHSGDREGAGACGTEHLGHRPVRGQRGVRAGGPGWAQTGRRSGEDQRQRRRDRDRSPVGRQRCADHDHAGQRPSSGAGATGCRRCARAAVWPTRRSSRGSNRGGAANAIGEIAAQGGRTHRNPSLSPGRVRTTGSPGSSSPGTHRKPAPCRPPFGTGVALVGGNSRTTTS